LQMWEAYRPILSGKYLNRRYFLRDWMPEDTLKCAPVPPGVVFEVHPFAPHTTTETLAFQIRAEGHVLYYEYLRAPDVKLADA